MRLEPLKIRKWLSNYKKGRRYEYHIRDVLRSYGWVVWRLAGSKPIDLIAFRGYEIAMIECKSYECIREKDVKHLIKLYCQTCNRDIKFYLVKPVADGDIAILVDQNGIAQRRFVDEVFM